MECNDQTELRKWGQTHRWSRVTAGGGGGVGDRTDEKGLMDMDSRVVIAGGRKV